VPVTEGSSWIDNFDKDFTKLTVRITKTPSTESNTFDDVFKDFWFSMAKNWKAQLIEIAWQKMEWLIYIKTNLLNYEIIKLFKNSSVVKNNN